jgi:SulP family sulfate permease
VAGVVLGVESVPDGLASGLLAGLNPVFGLHAYLFGTFSAALATSSVFMTVQGTGAMAIVVSDVDSIRNSLDPSKAVFTLTVLTGIVMLAAGLLRLGSVLRFVSTAVMVGFINAVGVNIVLGQFANFTGYAAEGSNRVERAIRTILQPAQLDLATVIIGALTIVLIVVLERTPLKALGMVVAIVITSALVPLFGLDSVQTLRDIVDVPSSLPRPMLPSFRMMPELLVPALSLAFVGLVQGAAISANFPNPDGTYPDASRDFVGQGVGNIVTGAFQGMPVGGSMSGTSITHNAGARTKLALFFASAVMAVIILAFGSTVGYIAMPALAGLLMLIGYRTVKPAQINSVVRIGAVQATTLAVTFVLTMIIPLQYAVFIGVGLSAILYVVQQSNQITVMRWNLLADGSVTETPAPATVPAHEVVVLQPYGSLFFAAAPVFEQQLPDVTPESRGSVVVLRLRGRTDLGTTFMDVLKRYAQQLGDVGSKLVIVSADERIHEQLRVSGATELIGLENIYDRDERLHASVRAAHRDAIRWTEEHR